MQVLAICQVIRYYFTGIELSLFFFFIANLFFSFLYNIIGEWC